MSHGATNIMTVRHTFPLLQVPSLRVVSFDEMKYRILHAQALLAIGTRAAIIPKAIGYEYPTSPT